MGEAEEAAVVATATDTPLTSGESNGVATPTQAGVNVWPDESAEAAFLADARERGETPVPAKPPPEAVEETETRPLPKLDELVPRIPPAVREALDDLFRARFVRVARVPRSALKR